jgi:general secretion pathway protein D
VAIRISLEVSNVIDAIKTNSGSVAYRIGTRSATTLLQLKDGENQVLAGLINNEDRSSGRKVPGLGNLPIVGRLFGNTNDTTDKTEIVLSITPHLVRTIQRPAASASEFSAGTEGSFRRRPDAVSVPVALPVRPTNVPAVAAPVAGPAPQPPEASQPVPSPAGQGLPASALPATPTLNSPAVPPAPQNGVVVTPLPAPQITPVGQSQ